MRNVDVMSFVSRVTEPQDKADGGNRVYTVPRYVIIVKSPQKTLNTVSLSFVWFLGHSQHLYVTTTTGDKVPVGFVWFFALSQSVNPAPTTARNSFFFSIPVFPCFDI